MRFIDVFWSDCDISDIDIEERLLINDSGIQVEKTQNFEVMAECSEDLVRILYAFMVEDYVVEVFTMQLNLWKPGSKISLTVTIQIKIQ